MKASVGEVILGCLAFVVMAILLCQMFPNLWIFFVMAAIVIIALIINSIVRNRKAREVGSRAADVDYSFYTKVVGVTFNGIQNIIPTLHSGMHLDFVREPYNTHDSNAIAVKCRGENIGHLSAELAAELAPLMDSGISVDGEIKDITGGGSLNYGCNIEVTVYKPIRQDASNKPPAKPKSKPIPKEIKRELPQPKIIDSFDPVTIGFDDLPFIYFSSPIVYSLEKLNEQAANIRPQKYNKRRFTREPKCSREEVEKELRREAEATVPGGLFREKNIEGFVSRNIDKAIEQHKQEHEQWQKDKEIFDAEETEFAEKCKKIYEQDARNEIQFIHEKCNADEEYIIRKINQRFDQIVFPHPLNPAFEYNTTEQTVTISIDLLQIEQLTPCNTQKETKLKLVKCAFSIAIYISSVIFDITPKIKQVVLSEKTSRRSKDGDLINEFILSIKFLRELFETVTNWREFDPQEFCLKFENRCNITATGIMKAIKPYEQS